MWDTGGERGRRYHLGSCDCRDIFKIFVRGAQRMCFRAKRNYQWEIRKTIWRHFWILGYCVFQTGICDIQNRKVESESEIAKWEIGNRSLEIGNANLGVRGLKLGVSDSRKEAS